MARVRTRGWPLLVRAGPGSQPPSASLPSSHSHRTQPPHPLKLLAVQLRPRPRPHRLQQRKPAAAVASHPPHRAPPLAPAPAQPHPASPRQPCPPPRPSLLQPLFALSGLPAALALARAPLPVAAEARSAEPNIARSVDAQPAAEPRDGRVRTSQSDARSLSATLSASAPASAAQLPVARSAAGSGTSPLRSGPCCPARLALRCTRAGSVSSRQSSTERRPCASRWCHAAFLRLEEAPLPQLSRVPPPSPEVLLCTRNCCIALDSGVLARSERRCLRRPVPRSPPV